MSSTKRDRSCLDGELGAVRPERNKRPRYDERDYASRRRRSYEDELHAKRREEEDEDRRRRRSHHHHRSHESSRCESRSHRHHDNPHVAQCDAPPTNIPFSRILAPDATRMPYRRRRGEDKSVIHWGQRKLLMSEIEFLTRYGHTSSSRTVVYAGAAPGTHTNWLADIFPDLKFVLVDPNPFVAQPTDRVEIVKDYFTDETAQKYAGQSVLFISDVRTANWREQDENAVEKHVMHDMLAQQRWVEIMKPSMSMLKFRLPYPDREGCQGSTEYLDGEVFLPVWGPQTTTETRLVTPGTAKRQWDHTVYEQQMFFFNTQVRVGLYDHDVRAVGLDRCYDCTSEVRVLREYLDKYGLESLPWARDMLRHRHRREPEDEYAADVGDEDDKRFVIGRLSEYISRICSPKGRTLQSAPVQGFNFDNTIRNHPLL
ncbi:poly A polymerase regulatory subunit [Acanthamoeba castellanii medusavirus]|uniref:Cap-specific mRNA (nucleoside-2'-O-)-methyltransferase n=1 Tax=Acanthamoeba castellanii medusavirus J1 TaxID=3114988 RepID=A0A3T1CWT2_9VIRU|nr:poly A polymerase regulatory subunit [Acanthamoeba castellanii medusavirus]BBI30265.1 poly A polymerase regulatory subunit [Acanthamoeba castellanii medusavirus J1]